MQFPEYSDLLSQGVLWNGARESAFGADSSFEERIRFEPHVPGGNTHTLLSPMSQPHIIITAPSRHWPPPALAKPQPSAQSSLVTKKGLENPFGGRLRRGHPQCHETRANTKCGVIGGFLIPGPLYGGAEPAAGLPGRAGPWLPALRSA